MQVSCFNATFWSSVDRSSRWRWSWLLMSIDSCSGLHVHITLDFIRFEVKFYCPWKLRHVWLHLRTTFTRFRTSSHRLKIETGRWSRIERERRVCQCGNGVQTEEHVLVHCELAQGIRQKYGHENISFSTFMAETKSRSELTMLYEILKLFEIWSWFYLWLSNSAIFYFLIYVYVMFQCFHCF